MPSAPTVSGLFSKKILLRTKFILQVLLLKHEVDLAELELEVFVIRPLTPGWQSCCSSAAALLLQPCLPKQRTQQGCLDFLFQVLSEQLSHDSESCSCLHKLQ